MTGERVNALAWQDTNDIHPSPARVHTFLVGGALHCPLDRAAAARLLEALPCAEELARAQLRFATAAVEEMLARGIKQFLDLGSGMPAAPSPAYTINDRAPTATVVMVENHPSTAAQALRLARPGMHVVHADLTDTDEVLHARTSAGPLVDLNQPLGVLAIDSLHSVTDHHRLRQALADYRAAATPGSALAVTVLSDISTNHPLLAYLDYHADEGTPVQPISPDALQAMLAPWVTTPQILALDDLPAIAALTWAVTASTV
ncbi:SAM-dependent methyltransferase [Crossiella sp. SN42]|uniref:SAM-dependent methyltransferase n=1 Tax=Crossiella sp. SN42 TaxID=2944808 RepID=UPI00207D2FC7|nr:SAM-dependent methyltransferase [Crossiella sp. SN42]MCO1575168.1 SAM-dependent methyltransferase [Crossiella sp. SN42]